MTSPDGAWVSIYMRPTIDGLYDYWHARMGVAGGMFWERGMWRAVSGDSGILMDSRDLWRSKNE